MKLSYSFLLPEYVLFLIAICTSRSWIYTRDNKEGLKLCTKLNFLSDERNLIDSTYILNNKTKTSKFVYYHDTYT